jgi:hypothetical protein
MRTRENSVIVSLRVERELQHEFAALALEIGMQPARKHRDAFIKAMDEMRTEANEKRIARGDATWEDEWASRNAGE